MASLWFDKRQIGLGTFNNLDELKTTIAKLMSDLGFASVVINELEVAGNRNPGGVRASIVHVDCGGGNLWQIVMACGDNLEAAQEAVNELKDLHP